MGEYKKSLKIFAVMAVIKEMWLGCLLSVIYFKFVGLNDFKIGLFHLIIASSLFFLEIPTGIFADKFGYKKSISLSYFFLFLAFSSYVSANFFGGGIVIYISAFLFAITGAFHSGATSSYIYSIFKIEGKTEKYLDYNSKIGGIGLIFKAGGALLASFLYNISEILPYSVQAVLIFFMFILSLFLKPIPVIYREKKQTFFDYSKMALKYFFNSKTVLFLFIFLFFSTIGYEFFNHMLNQNYWLEKDLSITNIGFLGVFLFLINGILSLFISDLWKIFGKKYIFSFLAILGIIISFGLYFFDNFYVIIIFSGLYYFLHSACCKIIDYSLQEAISQDEIRASILSTGNMFLTFMQKGLFLFVGLFALKYSYSEIILIIGGGFGIMALLIGIVQLFILKNKT
ncbi:MAG: hypothetical protein N4A38_01150 [Candidatus Gracilibacteria bacterium]|nr:hypothetical protein [Candidatus Gracilibacteria bacterium]